ncbi:DUF1302 domain-containing protein [Ectopseudomonas oleovorans]|uniref:DUF1302 domain-containing protein n=1 Tax=Ectopseudomonas oleovorans TaxID=301 RepID=A0AA42QBI3_ECTOL|nr:DUF1302 domain-containing protein [Pseudomonas oleovorans]MDH1340738.1 DUF1302 domain-containing protein [Pseudomonas oleovorans]MDH1494424.1 DUF1302 domain-containing protein [Pseudomonas oleovorans]WGG22578.1 DUF1302 domain-containing protein [Pseudomonas oleovorans]
MEIKSRKPVLRFAPAKAGFAFAGVLPLLVAAQAHAVEFSFADNEITGSLDTTISYGQLWRVQGQDKTNNDVNTNDGNRNFDTGLVSEVFKITSDLEASYQNYGVFVRGTAFYDTQIMDKRNDYYDTSLAYQPSQNVPKDDSFTRGTRHSAGRNAEILDAYVYGNWDIANMPVSARFGKQVFNWGEGLFYRGGVNTTNPVDAGKFRLPGAEVKEVLVPVEALSFAIGLTDNLSMDAFYQFNWKESAIDPVGTFFSETDLFGEGGNTAYNNFAGTALAPAIAGYNGLAAGLMGAPALAGARAAGMFQNGVNASYGDILKVADVTSDVNAKNDGQYGFSFRYIAEELNSTEFGFYFVNYHAKEPTIYADLNGYEGVDLQALATVLGGGVFNPALVPTAGGLATVDLLGSTQAKREYAEDIRMYGFSFNTTINETSVFGELAYRPNLPVGISATNDLLGDIVLQGAQLADTSGITGPNAGTALISGQWVGRDGSVSNSRRVEAFNISVGAIHNFGNVLSFDSLFGVAEIASEHLRADSLKYQAVDGDRCIAGRANTSYSTDAAMAKQDCASRDAYGYTLVLSGTWNDVYAGVNLSPFAVFKHDFQGNGHQTGNFIEDRKAYTVGLRASYLNSLEAEIQYTEFMGGGQSNSGRDRDNIGLNVKYSF